MSGDPWDVVRSRQTGRVPKDLMTWAEIDQMHGGRPDPELVYLFESAGMAKPSATSAAAGIAEGSYSTFEEAAIAETAMELDANAAVTDEKIARAAERAKDLLSTPAIKLGREISESLKISPWGRPLKQVEG